MKTIGEALIEQLARFGTDTVFGIPGVHTVELYRGLVQSNIRHITPRHEQGAGFMADGYARSTGKIGVAFVITGPGITNIITAMAQARADSIPMLVISSVNTVDTLGKGLGCLHELPDQHALVKTVAMKSFHATNASEMIHAVKGAFEILNDKRGGPVHIQIPLEILGHTFDAEYEQPQTIPNPSYDISSATALLEQAKSPVILAGGGAKFCTQDLTAVAQRLDAPVVQTVNARGLMHAHPLCVPASPSLPSVRKLIQDADVVLALGTELGPTDYDMYKDDGFPEIETLIRVDIDADQLDRHSAAHAINARVEDVLPKMLKELTQHKCTGETRANETREAAFGDLSNEYRDQIHFLNAIRTQYPQAIMVGDSTQPIYAGNLYYDHDRPAGWFNAATGFGALGLAIPAAVGASIANPSTPVICIAGDGGAQFSVAELMCATDNKLPILFILWNNNGFGEIDSSMRAVGIDPVGCDPTAPDFKHVAAAARMPFQTCANDLDAFKAALTSVDTANGPAMLEVRL